MTTTISEADRKNELASTLNAFAPWLHYIKPGVIVHVHNESDGHGYAPAWYVHGTDDIVIHVDRAEVPEALNGSWTGLKEKVRRRLLGLLAHEAAHSAWSHWLNPRKLFPDGRTAKTKAAYAVLEMLEELRIENRAVAASPIVAQYLRAALPLVISGLTSDSITSRNHAARAWALIYGRTLSGIIEDNEVDWVDETARIVLGDDDVDILVELLSEAVALPASESERLIDIAHEWVEIVGPPEPGEEDGEGEGSGGTCSHDPDAEPSEEEGDKGDKSEETTGPGRAVGDGLTDKPDEPEAEPEETESDAPATTPVFGGLGGFDSQEEHDTKSESEGEAYDPITEAEAEAMRKAIVEALEHVEINWSPDRTKLDLSDPAALAAKVFGKKTRKGRLVPQEPTHIERTEIVKTARALESLVLPAITKRTVPSTLPPGRLRNREAIRASAERAQGMLSTAKPWRTTKRRHDTVKPIVVGIMTDVSGSMHWAEQAVAQFAYVWGNAANRIAARAASVTFGDQADAVIRPGEVPAKVMVKRADGGSEHFDHAAAALDGVLKLGVPNGSAKVVLVISDAHLVISREADRAYEWCRKWVEAGTTVVWITPSSHGLTERLSKDGLATVVEVPGVRYGVASDEGTVFDRIQEAALTALARGNA